MKDEFSAYIGEKAVLADQGFVSAREFAAIIASALWPTYSDKGRCSVTQLAWEKRMPEEIRAGRVSAYNPITKEQLIPPQEGMAWGYDTNPQLLLDYLLSVREAIRLAEVSGIKLTVGGPTDQAEEIAAARSKIAELERALLVKQERLAGNSDSSTLLGIAIQVRERYWGANWDPNDRDSQTSQKDIVNWILGTFPNIVNSDATAKAIEKVACPFDRNPSKRT